MPTRNNNNEDVFVMTLSNARKNSAQSAKASRQFSEAAESFELRRHLKAWASIAENDVKSLDHCFERIGEKPVDLPFRLEDALAPDLKAELPLMQTSTARQLYILIKATELALRSMAAYQFLISGAEETGHYEVSAVLGTILAHTLAFMQQNQRLMQELIESRIAATCRSAASEVLPDCGTA